MAGIEDLKLWRTEPFLETFQQFSPEGDLGWKYDKQGRWFAPSLDYPRNWLGTDTIIKELDTKFPFNFSDPNTYKVPIAGNDFITYGSKTASQLAADQQLLKNWFPIYMGQDDIVKNIDQEFFDWRKDFYKKRGNNTKPLNKEEYKIISDKLKQYTTNMTQWEKDALFKMSAGMNPPFSEITPPQHIANQAKINLWESFLQNFRKPKPDHLNSLAYKNIYTPKNRWENISRIPIKVKDIYNRMKKGEKVKLGIPWAAAAKPFINNKLAASALGYSSLPGALFAGALYTGTAKPLNAGEDEFFNPPLSKTIKPFSNTSNTINNSTGFFNSNPVVFDKYISNKMNALQNKQSGTTYGPAGMGGFNSGGIASLVI